jgi:hypothetical protein
MECTILEILRGDRRFGPHIWLKMRIEPRGPEVFVPVFGDVAGQFRRNQIVDVSITVTPVELRSRSGAPARESAE